MKFSHIALVAALFPITAMAEAPKLAPISDDVIHNWMMENPQVIIDSLTKYDQDKKAQQANELVDRVAAVRAELSADAPVIGNPKGDVEMVMFSDYRCPHCRNAHAELEELFNADPLVRVVIRELPILGDASLLAARYALALEAVVGQEAYAAANKRVFANADKISMEWITADITAHGFEPDKIVAMMDDESIIAKVQKNYDLAQKIGISGTPFFVVNETPAPGGLSAETMIQAVAEERAKIQAAKQ